MFGKYTNFPSKAHIEAIFSTRGPIKELQKLILRVLCRLNREKPSPTSLNSPALHNCIVSFEFGLADGFDFNYLDDKELKHALEKLRVNSLSVLDFFCVIHYHKIKGEKRVPLRFDYCMLRFKFSKKSLILRVFHERGTRRLSLEDLVHFISEQINLEARKRKTKLLILNALGRL